MTDLASPPATEPLAPEMPAEQALRRLLLRQLDAIAAHREGAGAGEESEHLHDLRVAVRRSRTLLGQFKTVLPQPSLRQLRKDFSWLAEITGPTRDLDVHLQELPGYRELLPEARRDDLEPLHAYLLRRRQREQRQLARRLAGKRFQRLTEGWRRWLQAPPDGDPAGADAGTPILQLADRRIGESFARVIARGEALGAASPDQDFHELRKRCKKLRYLLEFFAPLYPAQPLQRLIKPLKRLQDLLGGFQDLSVQMSVLREDGRQLGQKREVPPETLLAIGMLLDRLWQKQQRLRGRFHKNFAGFAAERNRALLAQLFPGQTPKPPEE